MTQASYCFCSGTVTQTEPAYSLDSLSPRPQTLTCSHTAMCSPGLPFNDLHPCNPCNYMDYYSFTDPKWMEGWVVLVGWPIVDNVRTKWLPVNHRSGTGTYLMFTNIKHYRKLVVGRSSASAWRLNVGSCAYSANLLLRPNVKIILRPNLRLRPFYIRLWPKVIQRQYISLYTLQPCYNAHCGSQAKWAL